MENHQGKHVRVYRGRPLHEVCHTKPQYSCLAGANPSPPNLRGFIILIIIALLVTNFRLVLENLMRYGFLVSSLPIPTSMSELAEYWPYLWCLIMMHVCVILAWYIERSVIDQHDCVKRVIVFALLVNVGLVLLVPLFTVRYYHPPPLFSIGLLSFSCTWSLKVWSFHHVCKDARKAIMLGEDMDGITTPEEASLAIRFPDSLTLAHFLRFTWSPTMCFQFHYPTNSRRSWVAIIRHLGEMIICLALMKVLVEQYMIITVQNAFMKNYFKPISVLTLFLHLSERLLKLSIPNLYVWLLMFLALFHHWLNVLGELTLFSDRNFYGDWWNAGSFGEYWRKWNLPIHNFVHRHVHKPLLARRVPRLVSSLAVFILSAMAHEYLVVESLDVAYTGLIFFSFIAQIPLMCLTERKFFKRHTMAGNVLFWVCFCFTGQPFAVLVYYYLWLNKSGAA